MIWKETKHQTEEDLLLMLIEVKKKWPGEEANKPLTEILQLCISII